ncbi:hypothetical protein K469DRAFT_589579 [Zopfia rhizophila CBS 207.26]|uniref:DUF6590 domain-containing protein n=1 Tax=Zopfia rhizophila CBS 207.26 TaxID=1314779 RepID=A0A6A6DSQ7_9PEZI|nr:hypothetical protein K469DRAFT_589579 [Zopfia rhizophila CBS 207.26]
MDSADSHADTKNDKHTYQLNERIPRQKLRYSNGIQYVENSEVPGELHSGYKIVNKPRAFFKKGRVIMVLWPEPDGSPNPQGSVYLKVRRFVVVRARSTFCLCIPISTYQGQATTKANVAAQDHAPVVPIGGVAQLHPEEHRLTKSPLYIKVEDPSISIDLMSRINFAKIYTLEYNIRVRNVGRISSTSIKTLEEYFVDSVLA